MISLLEETNLVVLNGLTTESNLFTFEMGQSCSVIDYVCCS